MSTSAKTPSQLADEANKTANDAIESTRAYAQNAVNAAGEKVRDLRREAEPTVEQIAARVQQAVQRGLDAASTTSARAQRRLEQAADVTGKKLTPASVNGEALHVDGTHGVTVNGAHVTTADIACTNGVIHVIDAVLMPKA